MDPLSIDILAETARGFFGARVQLEKKMAFFNAFVDALAQKALTVQGAAVHLNYLLLTPQNASAFYKAIGVPAAPFSAIPAGSVPAAVEKAGFSLTAKGKYHNILRQAYVQVEEACRDYLYGTETEDEDTGQGPIYLGMIMKMVEVINTEIRALNRNHPPSNTLQFVGQLNTEKQVKSATTGTPIQYAAMDEKLGYAPIDIDLLKIAQYPELPPLQTVAPIIRKFSDRLYADHKKEIKVLLADMRRSSKG